VWLVGSSEAKKLPGLGLVRFFPEIVYDVFELPSPSNAPKRDKQIEKKAVFGMFCRFVCKNFSTRFFCTIFFVAF
jgi:hypothetical protein